MKAVIFDVDGMVLHGERFSDSYAREFGIPAEDMAPFFTEPFDICIQGKGDLKEELVAGDWLLKWKWNGTVEGLLDYWFHTGDEIDEKVLSSVAELRASAIVCVLTTNQEKYRTAYLRDTLGLARQFDFVFVSNEVGYKKPHPKFFDAVMHYLQTKDPSIQRSDVVFWDDREAYEAAAKEYGFQAYVFRDFDGYEQTMNLLRSQ
jgi:FMN phosphatase YigB (HAD superfamily)